jgi:hypothetical protein
MADGRVHLTDLFSCLSGSIGHKIVVSYQLPRVNNQRTFETKDIFRITKATIKQSGTTIIATRANLSRFSAIKPLSPTASKTSIGA